MEAEPNFNEILGVDSKTKYPDRQTTSLWVYVLCTKP